MDKDYFDLFREENNRRLAGIESKLEELVEYKYKIAAHAKVTSLVVSGLVSLFSFALPLVWNHWVDIKPKDKDKQSYQITPILPKEPKVTRVVSREKY